MTVFLEPLEVPMGRTLLLLDHWHRKRPAERLTVAGAAAGDFCLRFPRVLDAVAEASSRSLPDRARPTSSEELAPENDVLNAHWSEWPRRHQLVIGALIGKGLSQLSSGDPATTLVITAAGATTAQRIALMQNWTTTAERARQLNALRIAPGTLVDRTARAATIPAVCS